MAIMAEQCFGEMREIQRVQLVAGKRNFRKDLRGRVCLQADVPGELDPPRFKQLFEIFAAKFLVPKLLLFRRVRGIRQIVAVDHETSACP